MRRRRSAGRTGTCVVERRPITIHQPQHFRSRHIGSSCSAAPIFGVGDELIGVLDISSTDPALSEHAHNLAGILAIESARAIEERVFREQCRRHWIVAIAFPQAAVGTALLAVDQDRQIVGVDHNARALFARTVPRLGTGVGLWTLFEHILLPHRFVLERRLSLARDLLTGTDRPIADIAIAAGFSDQSHLARYFRQSFAVSPNAFRRSHR